MSQSNRRAKPGENEIVIERIFNAPRELVWRAWTDPTHVAAWWGPRGFTTRVDELDCRAGGRTRYVMIGPDGKQYPVTGQFIEVEPGRKFVSTDEFGDDYDYPADDLPQGMVITVTLEDVGNKTRMTLRIAHRNPTDRSKHEEMGVVTGWGSSFDCLDDLLATLEHSGTDDRRQMVMTRDLPALPEVVFDVWTDPAHVSNWWGPQGFSTTTSRHELRPGGVWTFVMHGPDGVDYHNRVEFVEIDRPRRLVYRHSGEGDASDVQFEAIVSFEKVGEGTRLTLQSIFPTAQRRDEVCRKYGAVEGARQTLTRLAVEVARRSPAPVRSDEQAAPSISITRVLAAPIGRVWDAWTRQEHVSRWMCPQECTILDCSADVRVGGWYRESMRCQGRVYTVAGRYQEVTPPHRLVFTHQWDEPGSVQTVVTVELKDLGGKTELRLTQTGFKHTDSARGHEQGWTSAMGNLEKHLAD